LWVLTGIEGASSRARNRSLKEETLQLVHRTFLLFGLNSAIDTGKYQDITIDEMKAAIRSDQVDALLHSRIGRDIDLSPYDPPLWAEFHKEWNDHLMVMNEQRKMGISKSGLCLLVGYLIESIQHPPE
jgi:hypothetical protein